MLKATDKRKLESLFDSIAENVEATISILKKSDLISTYSDQWFLDNLIFSVNPAELVKLLKEGDPWADDPPYADRDLCIEEALRLWLLVGNVEHERRALFNTIAACHMPYRPRSADELKHGTCYGISLDRLADVPPDLARISYLAGRLNRADVREKHNVRPELQKRRNQVKYAVQVLRVLHYFIDELGEHCPDVIPREAVFNAIWGEEAVFRNLITRDELESSKKLFDRTSLDTSKKAWKRYQDQAVILYALSSISVSDEETLLDQLFEARLFRSRLLDNLPRIMARAHYINNHVVSKLSDASSWSTRVPKKPKRPQGISSEKPNTHTINLICEFDVEPEGFTPKASAPDIIDWLSYHLKISRK